LFVCRIKEGVVRLEDAQVGVVFVQGHLILQVADRIVPTAHPCGMRCKNSRWTGKETTAQDAVVAWERISPDYSKVI
jgi:hypothetical protein